MLYLLNQMFLTNFQNGRLLDVHTFVLVDPWLFDSSYIMPFLYYGLFLVNYQDS